jgi:hypothetical protein
MIQLCADHLVFVLPNGESVPCAVEQVVRELIDSTPAALPLELVRHTAAVLLHYFRHDLKRVSVTLTEFGEALEKVLRSLGCDPEIVATPASPRADLDLRALAAATDDGFELGFFSRLRDEFRQRMGGAPQTLRCHGLRGCVKRLTGARRWSPRCQRLNDQIVDFLRECLSREGGTRPCALLVK